MNNIQHGDIVVNLYECHENIVELMKNHGIKCRAMASVPMADEWWIFDAAWEGDLPKGFICVNLEKQRSTGYYNLGMFTEGMNGTRIDLPTSIKRIEND